MTNFTKGPWRVDGYLIIGDNGYTICDLWDYTTYYTNNAHLIAAAPEMYEALKNIENDDNSMNETAWLMIKDALAKAEGKA